MNTKNNNLISTDLGLRMGPGIITCGGITLQADDITLMNATQLVVAGMGIEQDDDGKDYHINTAIAAEGLRQNYPTLTRTTSMEDIANSKSYYEAMRALVIDKTVDESIFLLEMYDALRFAVHDHRQIELIYAAYINDVCPNMIGLLSIDQNLEIANLYFRKTIKGTVPDRIFYTADMIISCIPPAVRFGVTCSI